MQSAIARAKERICGICSADLCAHQVCRICGTCEDCDTAEGARVLTPRGSDGLRSTTPQSSTPTFKDASGRLAWLRRLGITEADLPDADRALCELRSDCCACKCRKLRMQSFCRACFNKLDFDLQKKLYLHFKHGYLTYVRQAWAVLRGCGRVSG